MNNGFSRGSRQQANASRPDGRSALRMLANDSAGSAKNITPNREASKIETCRRRTDRPWHRRARNRPALLRRDSAARAPASAPRCRCRATCPLGPTFCANAIVVAPQPQPTSMIRSPGFGLARSIRMSATGAKQDVLGLLPVGPALAARPVPVGDLVGVLIVAYGCSIASSQCCRSWSASPVRLGGCLGRLSLRTLPQGSEVPCRECCRAISGRPSASFSASICCGVLSLSSSPYRNVAVARKQARPVAR